MSVGMLKLKSNGVAGGDNNEMHLSTMSSGSVCVCVCVCMCVLLCADKITMPKPYLINSCVKAKSYVIHAKHTIKNTLFAFGSTANSIEFLLTH